MPVFEELLQNEAVQCVEDNLDTGVQLRFVNMGCMVRYYILTNRDFNWRKGLIRKQVK